MYRTPHMSCTRVSTGFQADWASCTRAPEGFHAARPPPLQAEASTIEWRVGSRAARQARAAALASEALDLLLDRLVTRKANQLDALLSRFAPQSGEIERPLERGR